jgi:hypothetical protein
MLVLGALAVLSWWLAYIWVVDPDGVRTRNRNAAAKRKSGTCHSRSLSRDR